MQAAFQQAALPEPFTVLGKKLKPFTLGHDILLGVFESGFCRDVKTAPTCEDLLISTWICSFQNYQAVWEQLQNPALGKVLRKWGKSCGYFDVGEAFIAFSKYIHSHTLEPNYWVEDSGRGGRASDMPFSQFLKVTLMREFGMKEQEALDTPFAQAHWNYLTFLESNGGIRFMADADADAIKMASDPEVEKKLQALAQRIAHN
jgi:hypothetical protein